jgi:hypothetical protein
MAIKAFNQNLVGFRTVLGDWSRSFMFKIDMPQWLDDAGTNTLSMMVRSITLPAYKVKTSPIGFQGMKMQVASVVEFDQTWQVECLADEAQALRGNLLRWTSYIHDPGTMEGAALTSYKKDKIYVSQLDRLGSPVLVYAFYGLFPSIVESPKLGHDDVEPAKFNVTFTYDFYTVATGANAKAVNIGSDNSERAVVSAPNRNIPSNEVNTDEPAQVANRPIDA